jgi:hypothetical protein
MVGKEIWVAGSNMWRLKMWRVWIVMDCPHPISGPERSGKGWMGWEILIEEFETKKKK